MNEEQTSNQPNPPQPSTIESPPTSIGGILSRLGPGLIVAGSIVGSGELIATTSTGAQAGFWLLWLILIGCVIKVFVQVELGRYTIVTGKTTMDGLAEVPGPRIEGRGNWLVWFWFIMFSASIAQLGGIVGGVGQALAISAPITESGQQYNEYAESETELIVHRAEIILYEKNETTGPSDSAEKIDLIKGQILTKEVRSSDSLLVLKQAELQSVEKKNSSNPELSPIFDRLKNEIVVIEKYRSQLSSIISNQEEKNQLKNIFPKMNRLAEAEILRQEINPSPSRLSDISANPKLANLGLSYLAVKQLAKPKAPIDDKLWATLVTVLTAAVLIFGRYGLIQSFSTAMVGSFTLITVVNLVMLQSNPSWGVSFNDIINGMSFRLPPVAPDQKMQAIRTALATFGIIGVGASELVTYPYWCLEKGYARFTGPRDDSPSWAERAQGWMRVMRWDAWCSMVIYTFATIAFYLLGAAILGRTNLDPQGNEMIRYLSVMYLPVFGQVTQLLFLFGAVAVLYSTFFVANASQARVFADALRVLRLAPAGEQSYRRRVRFLSGLFPFLCLSFFVTGFEPRSLVMLSGLMQAIMLPMLAAAALYFRYYRSDKRVLPGKCWDILLWISAAGLLIAGAGAAITKIASFF